MSLYNDASLAMIPSAVKDGKLYSIRPTDGSGDFTFSRGSNLAATRVDVNGLIEKGRENLLLQSNQFDTTWTLNTATLTSGQTGYDGSSDAWELDASASGSYVRQVISKGGVHSFSFYAKAGTTDFVLLLTLGGGNSFFNLTTGVVATNSGLISANIESVGSGWYRCSITQNSSISDCRLYPSNSGGSSAGSIYIQDAQLEVGLVATDYIESTTTTAVSGITEDLPRLDYSGGASCPSLLLEPQRTNLFTQSEYFNSVDWTKTAINVTDNAVTSPEGIANAAKLVETTANSVHQINQSHSLSGNDYSFSVFVKKAERRYVSLVFSDFTRYLSQYTFDLEDGVLTNSFDYGGVTSTFVPEDYGNGWYRLTLSSSYASWSGAIIPRFYIENTATPSQPTANNYVGDGTSGVYIYGFQLESGSYPSSYIPTYGSAVTRSGDNSNTIDVSSLGVTTNYTLFYEISDFNVTANSTWVSQTSSNGPALAAYGNTMIIWVDGGFWYPFGHGASGVGSNTKKAITYDGVKVRAYEDGVLVGTRDADKNRWDNLTDFDMTDGSLQMVNWNQVLIFPTALTDSEAIALTTL
jgi:hypothetical protein